MTLESGSRGGWQGVMRQRGALDFRPPRQDAVPKEVPEDFLRLSNDSDRHCDFCRMGQHVAHVEPSTCRRMIQTFRVE